MRPGTTNFLLYPKPSHVLAIIGDANITEAPDTLNATGGIGLFGDASIIEAPDTLSATGLRGIAGDANITEAPDTLSADGTLVSSTVTGISPAIGFAFGKTPVTITGTGFSGAPAVSIGGVACTSVVVVSPTSITAVTGAKAGSTVLQTVAVASASLANAYEYADPSNPPGASVTNFRWINSQNVTLISGPKVSAAQDKSPGANPDATCSAGNEIPYNPTNGTLLGFPSFHQLNTDTGCAITFNEAIGPTTVSICMVGSGNPSSGQNYWWNDGSLQLVILPPPNNITVDSNGAGTRLSWSNGVDGIASPGVVVATLDGTSSAKLRVSAATPVSGNAGTIAPLIGTSMSVGSRNGVNSSQSINGDWTDFLMYSGTISASDAAYLERIFGAIYGITINP